MSRPAPMAFFWEVLWPSRVAAAMLAGVVIYAVYLTALSSDGFEEALFMLFVAQLVLSSTGYRDRLYRGHLDPLLAGRASRAPIVFAHFLSSIAPGLLVWTTFGLVARLWFARPLLCFTAGGLLAVLYGSVVVWVVSAWLGRNTGAVLWLLAILVMAATRSISNLRDQYGTVSVDWGVSLRAARAPLVLPLMMFVNGGHVEPFVIVCVVAATVAILAAGVWSIARIDAPLRSAQ